MKKVLERYPELVNAFGTEFLDLIESMMKEEEIPEDRQIEWFLMRLLTAQHYKLVKMDDGIRGILHGLELLSDLLQKMATDFGVSNGSTKH
jgi:hypothetical protein